MCWIELDRFMISFTLAVIFGFSFTIAYISHPINPCEILFNVMNGEYKGYSVDPKLLEINHRWVPFFQSLINITDVFVFKEVSTDEFNQGTTPCNFDVWNYDLMANSDEITRIIVIY